MIPESKFIDTYYFTNEIEKELEAIKLTLASGSCTSYDGYRYMVGIVEGMEKSKTILQDIANKFRNADDDDNDDN